MANLLLAAVLYGLVFLSDHQVWVRLKIKPALKTR